MPHQLIDTRAGMPESSSQVENVPQVVRAVRAEVGAVGVGAGDGAVVDPAEAVTGQDCASAGGGPLPPPGPPPAIGLPTIRRQRMGVFLIDDIHVSGFHWLGGGSAWN